MDNKQLKKLAVVSAITLFSSTILSSTNFQNGKLQLGTPVVLAEDPPVDEDVPDANELKKITDAEAIYNDTLALLEEESYSDEAKEFAKSDLDTIDLASLRAMNYTRAKNIVAQIDALYAKINGTDTTVDPEPNPQPTITKETEVFPVGTIYSEDPNAEANTQTVISEGTPGEITYIVTDGVRDQGTETTPMVPRRVSVGTKPTVVTEEIPAPADIEEKDSELEEGQRVLKSAGTKGSRTTTTTYSLDLTTGEAVANTPTVEETPGTAAVYRVGTKKVAQPPVVTTRTEVIPVTTVYTADPTKEANSQEVTFEGTAGEKTYTTTDGVEDEGVVTTVMQPKQVTVGTKPTVVTEVLPAPADIEEEDPTLEEGKRELKTPATDGSRTTTTTYSLDPATGLVTANEPVVEETPATAAVYRVGTKKVAQPPVVTTRTEVIPVTTVYTADPTKEANSQEVTFEGTAGEKTYTTTDGVEDDGVVTKVMQPKQVTVGTKPTVVTEVLPAPAAIEEEDPTLEEGKRELKTPATDGSRTTTTTYSLDPATGLVTANEPVVEETPATAAVYRVGTKKVAQPPVVTTRTEVIPVTTVYTADPTKEANSQEVTFEGSVGERTYTTTDGVEDDGVVTKVMQPKQVTVGTKPTVVTEVLPAPAAIEEEDPTLEEGKRELKTPATDGSRTTTTTYSLDPATGLVTANEPVVEETPATAAVYRVGTKKVAQPPVVTTRTEVIPVTTVYTEDPTKEVNSQEVTFEGSVGERTYTTTDGVEDDGVVTKVMQPKQVTVGTKSTVVTEVLPAPADVEEPDFNLEEGKRELKTPAVDGSRTTTTTYSLDPATGLVTANEPVVEETPGTAAVYRVGLKKLTPISVPEIKEETETETIGFTTEKRENPDLPKGETRVIQAGKDGVRTITYRVTTVDGIETGRVVLSDETTPAVVEIIEVGTKDIAGTPVVTEEMVTEAIGFTTEKRENPDLPKGETRVIQAGKDGARTITYRVITVDGIETSRVVVSDESVAPVAEIIEVGTKAVSSSDETTNQSSTNVATTTNPIVTSQLTKVIKTTIVKKELPKTGEQQSMLTMVGIALLGMVTAIFTLGKKKPKN